MKFKALTIQSQSGRFQDIITRVGVSFPVPPDGFESPVPTIYWSNCLWDTGASHSMISSEVVQSLKLAPIGDAMVLGAHGAAMANIYVVGILLPDLLVLPEVKVTECVANIDFNVVIGMDIISRGDFAITNVDGKSTFSFCVPGIETIDFAERIRQFNQ